MPKMLSNGLKAASPRWSSVFMKVHFSVKELKTFDKNMIDRFFTKSYIFVQLVRPSLPRGG